jgi:hypothetical protein
VEDVAAGGVGEGVEQAVHVRRRELTYNHSVVGYQGWCGRSPLAVRRDLLEFEGEQIRRKDSYWKIVE